MRLHKSLFTLLLIFICQISAANAHPSAEQIFKLTTSVFSNQGIQLNWHIADNAYLYKQFIKVTALDPHNVKVGVPVFPQGETKKTLLFGTTTIYHNNLSINVPVENLSDQSFVKLQLTYQGCSEQGQCFPPVTQTIKVDFPSQATDMIKINRSTVNTDSETFSIEQKLEHHSFWTVIGIFFALGLFLAITPCVLPMIPILSSIILQGHHQKNKKSKAFLLSLAYVFGIGIAYAALGFLMSWLGSNVQSAFQNPYILLFFSLIFIVLALSLFGLFDIKWPGTSNQQLAQISQKLANIACKNYATVTLMGFLSALVVSPCVTPPLVGALAYMTTTGDLVMGTVALFFMGFGMGIPLLFIGVFGSVIIPKAGRWMEIVKLILGLMLLGMAVVLWQRIIPPNTSSLLWGCFTIVLFILLLYRVRLTTKFMRLLFQTLCFIGILYGAFPVIEHITGHHLFYAPQPSNVVIVKNSTQLKHYLNQAKKAHKPVMVDFYADWCLDCKTMEASVFNKVSVIHQLKNFVWIKVDMTKDTQSIWDIEEEYGIAGPPTFLFYSATGKPLKQFNFVGVKPSSEVLDILKQVQKG